ncbi:Ankyrin repeat domain-containing protein 29, partial [Symbiodinium microadriaticum]
MLHIRTASGERLFDVNLASFHATLPGGMSAVRALKQHLHSMCGLSRFQRLIFLDAQDDEKNEKKEADDDVVLDDEHTLRPGEAQVVLLSFCESSEAQVKALLDAAESGRTAAVESLLQRPQDPDLCRERSTFTALFAASKNGYLEVVRLLLEANADKDKAAHDGATPLYIAAEQRHWQVVHLLLEANADKDKAMHDGATPLYVAAARGHR